MYSTFQDLAIARHLLAGAASLLLVTSGACATNGSAGDDGLKDSRTLQLTCDNVSTVGVDLCEPLRTAEENSNDPIMQASFASAFNSCQWAFQVTETDCLIAAEDGDPNQDPGQGDPNQDPGQGDPNQDPGQGDPNQDPGQGDPNQDPGQGDPNQDPGQEVDPTPGSCVDILDREVDCLALLQDVRDASDPDVQEDLLDAFEECFEDIERDLRECLREERRAADNFFDACFEVAESRTCDDLLEIAEDSDIAEDRAILISSYQDCLNKAADFAGVCQEVQDCDVIFDGAGVCDALGNAVLAVSDPSQVSRLVSKEARCLSRVEKAHGECLGR